MNQKRKAFFNSLSSLKNQTIWSLANNSYSEESIDSLVLSAISLQEIAFGNHCFSSFSSLDFSLFNQLKCLSIGDHSFCGKKTGSFILHNMDSLEQVTIGKSCFPSTSSFDIASRIERLLLYS